MADYSTWTEKKLAPTGLLLDTRNPRLPESAHATQRQIIDELVAHDAVYDLARSVASQGYFPTERLLGIRDPEQAGQVVIIEGNRRLAALKLLINPELAPESHLQRFRRLSESISPSMIAKVPVVIAPSREAATAILLSRHTSKQIQSWQRPMQARFYRQLLESGMTADQLIHQHGVTVEQIDNFVRADHVYRLACSLDFPESTKTKVTNTRDFPLSTLERLVQSAAVREFLQLKNDPNEILVSTAKSPDFLKAFRQVVSDVAEGKIDSRRVNDKDGIESYLKKIASVRPGTKSRTKFSVRKHLSETERPSPPIRTTVTRKKKPTKPVSVLPRDLKSHCEDARVHDVWYELYSLNCGRFRNGSALLLRVLLELSVSHYLETTCGPEFKKWVSSLRGKRKKDPSWYPSLRDLLEFGLQNGAFGLEGLQLKSVRMFINTKSAGNTLDALDGYAHNRLLDPNERELRELVSTLDPILRVTLGKLDMDAE